MIAVELGMQVADVTIMPSGLDRTQIIIACTLREPPDLGATDVGGSMPDTLQEV